MATRPFSMTMVGWWMALSSVIGLYQIATLDSNLRRLEMINASALSPASYQIAIATMSLIGVGSAYATLSGMPIGRIAYLLVLAIQTAVAITISPMPLATIGGGTLFLGLVLYLLFGAEANEWFDAKGLQLIRNDAR